MNDWRKSLLKTLGYKPTPQNLRFLSTWQRWEGGHTNNGASFNWLNTTHGDGEAINSVGVKKFRSYQEGIMNTAETLLNGRYQDILDALRSGNPYSSGPSAGLQTWVSGRPDGNPAYAQKVLGGKGSAALPPPPSPVRSAAPSPPRPSSLGLSDEDETWNFTMDFLNRNRNDRQFLDDLKKIPDFSAVSDGLVSEGGSVKPVPLPKAGGKIPRLIDVVQSALGKPYVFGSGPSTDSFDCSDLIQWAYKQIGVTLPRVTYDQIKSGRSVKGQAYQPGDLIFPHSGHVVMYVGNGKVIAAPYTGTVVQYQPVPSNPLEVRRIL